MQINLYFENSYAKGTVAIDISISEKKERKNRAKQYFLFELLIELLNNNFPYTSS